MTNTETTKATLVNLDNLKERRNKKSLRYIYSTLKQKFDEKNMLRNERITVSIYILGSIFAGFISSAKQVTVHCMYRSAIFQSQRYDLGYIKLHKLFHGEMGKSFR